MKTIATFAAGDMPITLYQRGVDSFRVVYGVQVRDRLSYTTAAHEFGECVFHSLACAGLLDNRTKVQS